MTNFAQSDTYETIQAFPVCAQTKLQVATDFNVSDYTCLRVMEDGDITFKFKSGATDLVLVGMLAGMDIGLSSDISTVTSTSTVLIS